MADIESDRNGEPARSRVCPSCRVIGHAIAARTVKALLTSDGLARLSDRRHFFCADPACDTVYFDDARGFFTRRDIRVPVYQKEPPGRRLVCYCFGESETSLLAEIKASGHSEAVLRIRQHITAGCCACDLRNPKGMCCLGDLVAAVDRLSATVSCTAGFTKGCP